MTGVSPRWSWTIGRSRRGNSGSSALPQSGRTARASPAGRGRNSPRPRRARSRLRSPRISSRATRTVFDINSGGSMQEVDTAIPNLRLFFTNERHDGFSLIRIAELVRQPNGQPIIRDNYVPPVLHIAASPFLAGGLRRVLSAIGARQRQL